MVKTTNHTGRQDTWTTEKLHCVLGLFFYFVRNGKAFTRKGVHMPHLAFAI